MLLLPGLVKATRTPLSNTSLTSARHGLENSSTETQLWKTVSNTDFCQQIMARDSSKACSAGHTALKMPCQLHYMFCNRCSTTTHKGQGCRKGSSWSAPTSVGFILGIFNTAWFLIAIATAKKGERVGELEREGKGWSQSSYRQPGLVMQYTLLDQWLSWCFGETWQLCYHCGLWRQSQCGNFT